VVAIVAPTGEVNGPSPPVQGHVFIRHLISFFHAIDVVTVHVRCQGEKIEAAPYVWKRATKIWCAEFVTCFFILVKLGVNTTTEIRLLYLWEELYEDFCRDSLVSDLPAPDYRPSTITCREIRPGSAWISVPVIRSVGGACGRPQRDGILAFWNRL
jgi:hypothetical protein